MKRIFYISAIGLVILSSCTHDKKNDVLKPVYNFSYPSGTLYTGDTLDFVSKASVADRSHWYFGNVIFARAIDGVFQRLENDVCDTCSVFVPWSYGLDTANGQTCRHIMYTPGSYKVTLTVNGDAASAMQKKIDFVSPEVLSSGMTSMRHWSRRFSSVDTSYAMTDTNFSLNVSGHICTTLNKSFPFNSYLSSSAKLVYAPDPDPHYLYPGSITYIRATDSVFIAEHTGTLSYSESIQYASGH